jgi:hypothetical protein
MFGLDVPVLALIDDGYVQVDAWMYGEAEGG